MKAVRKAAAICTLAAWGCQAGADTALGVAQRFVDAHYVRIDLAAARSYCAGVAEQKIRQEQDLTRGQAIDESTRQPSVHYRLEESRQEGDDRVSFLFDARIGVPGAEGFSRKWLVTARREAGGWKVANFHEFE